MMSYLFAMFAILNVCNLTGNTGKEEVQNNTLTGKLVKSKISTQDVTNKFRKSMETVRIESKMSATEYMNLPYLLKHFPIMLAQEIKCLALPLGLPTKNNNPDKAPNYQSDKNKDSPLADITDVKCGIIGLIHEKSIENKINELPLSVSVHFVLQLFTDLSSQTQEYEQLPKLTYDTLFASGFINEIITNNNGIKDKIFEHWASMEEKTTYFTTNSKDGWPSLLSNYATKNYGKIINLEFDFHTFKERFYKFVNSKNFKTFEEKIHIEKDRLKSECFSCGVNKLSAKEKDNSEKIKGNCDEVTDAFNNKKKSYCSNYFKDVIGPKYLAILNTKNNITELENTLELLTSKIEQYNRKDQSNDNIANILNLENDEKSTNVYFETFLLNTMLFRKELDIKINDLKREVSNLLRSYIKQNFLIYKHIIDMRLLINSALASKRKSNIDLK